MSLEIAPSILSADFLNLGKEVAAIDEFSSYIHLDVMDGLFVPNISFGFPVIDALKGKFKTPLDAHLMVTKPDDWFERLADDGVSMVSFHLEATGRRTSACIEKIHSLGMKAGVAIDPDVPVKKLFKYIGKADFFVIMSVFAGFGGQKFIYESIDRISMLKEQIDRLGNKAVIEVDGGVSLSNATTLREAGAGILVAGSSVFKSDNPSEMVRLLSQA